MTVITKADIDDLMQEFKNQHARDVIELLKLHEENARLQAELDHYTATDYITAAKAYNLEMGLRHEAEKENARLRDQYQELYVSTYPEIKRLQDIVDKQRIYFESILFIQNKYGLYKYAAACEIAIEALALTTTEKETKE